MKISPIKFFCLAALLAAGCHRENDEPSAPAAKVEGDTIRFETNAPQLGSLVVETAGAGTAAITHLTGRLSWNDDVTVHIFTPVAGRVVAVEAKLGDQVSTNSVLAEIDSPDFGQAVANARAAAGNLAAADKAFARSKELFEHGAAAQKDVETSDAAYRAALAERDRAYAVLAIYGGDEKSTNSLYALRSPLAGELVEKTISPGQEVRADQMLANATPLYSPLFVVSDPTKLWVQLDVSELEMSSLRVGQRLRIYSRAFPDKSFDGAVDYIGAELDPATRTVKLRGVANNPDKLLKAEMYVLADVELDTPQATNKSRVEIPAKAVFLQDEQYFVFVEESPGQFQRQPVKIGAEQDGRILIFQGIHSGQKVVTEGCLLLESLWESTDRS